MTGAENETGKRRQNVLPPQHQLHADIDIIDKCNLQCPTCWRGTAAVKNTSATMPIEKFRKIVGKLQQEGCPNIALINWTEPFLCENLGDYVKVVKDHDVNCWLSSNFSLPPKRYLPNIVASLEAGVDTLFVSVSGYSQEVYQLNHKKGRVDWIMDNLRGLAPHLASGRITTNVWIRYLEFPYNLHEKEPWQAFAEPLGIGFSSITASGNPETPNPGADIFDKHVMYKVSTAPPVEALKEPPQQVCSLIADRVAIDAKGDAYLCCALPNSPGLKIGPYAEMDADELLLKRHNHPFCIDCQIPERRTVTEIDRERFVRAIEHDARRTSETVF